jgi:hypothetical protein
MISICGSTTVMDGIAAYEAGKSGEVVIKFPALPLLGGCISGGSPLMITVVLLFMPKPRMSATSALWMISMLLAC